MEHFILKCSILISTTMILASCASAPWVNLKTLPEGTTKETAIKILGRPLNSATGIFHEDLIFDIASSPLDSDRSDTKTYVLRFEENRLISMGELTGVYPISVANFGDTDLTLKRAYVVPGNKNTDENDLKFKEFAKLTRQMLARKGYTFTSKIDDAQTLIFISYAVSDPTVSFEIESAPVYRLIMTPGQTTNTKINVSGSTGQHLGSLNSSSNTLPQFSNEYAGQRTQSRNVTTYQTTMAIQAYKNEHSSKPTPLWESTISAINVSGSLKDNVERLLSLGGNFIGNGSSKTPRLKGFTYNPRF